MARRTPADPPKLSAKARGKRPALDAASLSSSLRRQQHQRSPSSDAHLQNDGSVDEEGSTSVRQSNAQSTSQLLQRPRESSVLSSTSTNSTKNAISAEARQKLERMRAFMRTKTDTANRSATPSQAFASSPNAHVKLKKSPNPRKQPPLKAVGTEQKKGTEVHLNGRSTQPISGLEAASRLSKPARKRKRDAVEESSTVRPEKSIVTIRREGDLSHVSRQSDVSEHKKISEVPVNSVISALNASQEVQETPVLSQDHLRTQAGRIAASGKLVSRVASVSTGTAQATTSVHAFTAVNQKTQQIMDPGRKSAERADDSFSKSARKKRSRALRRLKDDDRHNESLNSLFSKKPVVDGTAPLSAAADQSMSSDRAHKRRKLAPDEQAKLTAPLSLGTTRAQTQSNRQPLSREAPTQIHHSVHKAQVISRPPQRRQAGLPHQPLSEAHLTPTTAQKVAASQRSPAPSEASEIHQFSDVDGEVASSGHDTTKANSRAFASQSTVVAPAAEVSHRSEGNDGVVETECTAPDQPAAESSEQAALQAKRLRKAERDAKRARKAERAVRKAQRAVKHAARQQKRADRAAQMAAVGAAKKRKDSQPNAVASEVQSDCVQPAVETTEPTSGQPINDVSTPNLNPLPSRVRLLDEASDADLEILEDHEASEESSSDEVEEYITELPPPPSPKKQPARKRLQPTRPPVDGPFRPYETRSTAYLPSLKETSASSQTLRPRLNGKVALSGLQPETPLASSSSETSDNGDDERPAPLSQSLAYLHSDRDKHQRPNGARAGNVVLQSRSSGCTDSDHASLAPLLQQSLKAESCIPTTDMVYKPRRIEVIVPRSMKYQDGELMPTAPPPEHTVTDMFAKDASTYITGDDSTPPTTVDTVSASYRMQSKLPVPGTASIDCEITDRSISADDRQGVDTATNATESVSASQPSVIAPQGLRYRPTLTSFIDTLDANKESQSSCDSSDDAPDDGYLDDEAEAETSRVPPIRRHTSMTHHNRSDSESSAYDDGVEMDLDEGRVAESVPNVRSATIVNNIPVLTTDTSTSNPSTTDNQESRSDPAPPLVIAERALAVHNLEMEVDTIEDSDEINSNVGHQTVTHTIPSETASETSASTEDSNPHTPVSAESPVLYQSPKASDVGVIQRLKDSPNNVSPPSLLLPAPQVQVATDAVATAANPLVAETDSEGDARASLQVRPLSPVLTVFESEANGNLAPEVRANDATRRTAISDNDSQAGIVEAVDESHRIEDANVSSQSFEDAVSYPSLKDLEALAEDSCLPIGSSERDSLSPSKTQHDIRAYLEKMSKSSQNASLDATLNQSKPATLAGSSLRPSLTQATNAAETTASSDENGVDGSRSVYDLITDHIRQYEASPPIPDLPGLSAEQSESTPSSIPHHSLRSGDPAPALIEVVMAAATDTDVIKLHSGIVDARQDEHFVSRTQTINDTSLSSPSDTSALNATERPDVSALANEVMVSSNVPDASPTSDDGSQDSRIRLHNGQNGADSTAGTVGEIAGDSQAANLSPLTADIALSQANGSVAEIRKGRLDEIAEDVESAISPSESGNMSEQDLQLELVQRPRPLFLPRSESPTSRSGHDIEDGEVGEHSSESSIGSDVDSDAKGIGASPPNWQPYILRPSPDANDDSSSQPLANIRKTRYNISNSRNNPVDTQVITLRSISERNGLRSTPLSFATPPSRTKISQTPDGSSQITLARPRLGGLRHQSLSQLSQQSSGSRRGTLSRQSSILLSAARQQRQPAEFPKGTDSSEEASSSADDENDGSNDDKRQSRDPLAGRRAGQSYRPKAKPTGLAAFAK